MANFCHECAQRVAPTMRACPNCGTALVGIVPRATTATPPRPNAGAYTPNLSGLHAAPRVPPAPDATSASAARDTSGASSASSAFVPPVPPRTPGFDLGATPPASTSPYARAAAGQRLVAWLIDGALGILALVPGAVLVAAGYAADEDEGMMVIGGTMFLAGLVWALWYGLTKDGGRMGQSIGKRHVGLMVVHLPSDLPCTRAQSAVRALVALVTNVVPAIGWLIEPVMVLIGEDGRRLGDRAAETQVIAVADYPAKSAA
jgi:uncharacterized RDD family membrane protein YckC